MNLGVSKQNLQNVLHELEYFLHWLSKPTLKQN